MLPGRSFFAMLVLLVACVSTACGGGDDDANGDLATSTANQPTATPAISPTPPVEPTSSPAATPSSTVSDDTAGGYELSAVWGGPVVPQFPYDVALLDDGRIAVADLGLNQIHIFAADGSLETSWPATIPGLENESAPFLLHRVAAANDSLYVGFFSRRQLARYDMDGRLLSQYVFEQSEPRINDLGVGPDGRIYMVAGAPRSTSGAQYDVFVFDADLNLLESWEAPHDITPVAIAFDLQGDAHVLLRDNAFGDDADDLSQPAHIARIDPMSYSPEDWETPLELPVEGQFDALAVADDGRYVLVEESSGSTADSDVTAVHIVPSDSGDPVRWELPEQSAVGLTCSTGLAITDAGTLLIVDPMNNRFLDVSMDGEILRAIEDDRSGRFAQPGGLAVGPEGNLFVSDGALGAVQVFTSEGELLDAFEFSTPHLGPLTNPVDVAVGQDGTIYVIDSFGPSFDAFRKIAPDGRESVIEVDVTQDMESRFLFGPESAAIGPDGLIYLSMNQQPAVRAYSSAGETMVVWPADPNSIGEVHQVAAGPDGIFATVAMEVDGRQVLAIKRVDESEETVAIFQVDQEEAPPTQGAIDALPFDVAVGPDGFFYALDSRAQVVVRISPEGRETGRWDIGDDTERLFESVAVDEELRIYVTDVKNRQILVYKPA